MKVRMVFLWLLAVAFVAAGINHFRDPAIYLAMMPPWLPKPELLVQISGAAEIAGGVGVLIPFTRRVAGWGLIGLLLAVFPANLYVAVAGLTELFNVPRWVLWFRLPFQVVMIVWVWWVAISRDRDTRLD
jgi:uncharacterized membrane protein